METKDNESNLLLENFEIEDDKNSKLKKRIPRNNYISKLQIVLALIRSMVGTNLFTMSAVLSTTKWGWGALVVMICAFLNYLPLHLLFISANKEKDFSYQSLVERNLKSRWLLLFNILALFKELSGLLKGMTDSINFLSSLAPKFPSFVFALIIATVMLALTGAKNNHSCKLKQYSLLNFFNVLTFLILIAFIALAIYELFLDQSDNPFAIEFEVISAVPTISKCILGFSAETNLLDILSKAENTEELTKDTNILIVFSILLTSIFYLGIGYLGYRKFGETFPNSNILLSYGKSGPNGEIKFDVFVTIGVALAIIFLLFYIHFKLKPVKDSLEQIFTKKADVAKGWERFKFYSGIVSVAFLIVTFWPSYSEVTELIENIAGPAIIYVFPIIIYFKVFF